jgi:hypothetical protein
MMRMSKFYKVTNALLLLFPIFFGVMVFYSITSEDNKMIIISNKKEREIECSGSLFLNISFAVILAAAWNGKKIIKIGAI